MFCLTRFTILLVGLTATYVLSQDTITCNEFSKPNPIIIKSDCQRAISSFKLSVAGGISEPGPTQSKACGTCLVTLKEDGATTLKAPPGKVQDAVFEVVDTCAERGKAGGADSIAVDSEGSPTTLAINVTLNTVPGGIGCYTWN